MKKCSSLISCVIAFAVMVCICNAAEKIEPVSGKAEGIKKENVLISKVEAALKAKNWQEAEDISKQLIVINPERWEYQRALADAELYLGKYQEAVDAYEKALILARNSSGGDLKSAKPEIRQAASGMLTRQGNALLKIKKNSEAIAAYTNAAEFSDKPGLAYFNLCATQYNSGDMNGALKSCEKAIQFDPNRADAYFIKGSALFGNGSIDKSNKYTAPAGTAEALNKYLKLAPDGGHAKDVKEMLRMIETR